MAEKIKKQIKKNYKKIVGSVLILSLILTYGAFVPKSRAAALTYFSDTLTDSRPSTVYPNHTIKFRIDNATTLANTETLTVTFTGFQIGSTDSVDGDFVLSHSATENGSYTNFANPTDYDVTDQLTDAEGANPAVTFTFTATAETSRGTDQFFKIVFTNETNELPNPTAGVQTVTIGGNFGDTGSAKVAIVAGVSVSATVAETLQFNITNVAAASCPNMGGTDQSDEAGHNASTVPFGTITPETFYYSCQSLQVKTNAATGYTATVQETDQLKTASAVEFLDGDCDGTCSETVAQTWTTATNDGFGYCMYDVTGDGANTAGLLDAAQCDTGASSEYRIFPEKAIDSPDTATIMSSVSAVSDTSYIGYKINAAYTQTAGTYTTTTVFVATPKY